MRVILVLWPHTASVPTPRGQLQDRKLKGWELVVVAARLVWCALSGGDTGAELKVTL